VGDETRSSRKDSILTSIRQLRDSQYQFSNLQELSQKDLEQLSIRTFANLELVNHECLLEATNVSSADQSMQEQLLKCVLGVSTTLKGILSQSVLLLTSREVNGKDSLSLQLAIKNGIAATESLVQLSYAASERTSFLIKAIDSALSTISRAIVTLQSSAEEFGLERPGDLLVVIQSLEDAAEKISQNPLEEEVSVVLVNDFKLQSEKLLAAVKACVEGAPDEIRQTVVDITVAAAKECTELLMALKQGTLNSSKDSRGGVAAQFSDLVDALARLSVATGKLEPDGYADKADPNLANEQDLADLAADLEVASRHLAPPPVATESPAVGEGELELDGLDNEPQADGLIGKAVKNIALAIASLLKASISSQREIVARGRKLPPAEAMYFSDGKWSEGIISAAKEVGHVGRELCSLAKDMANVSSPGTKDDLPLRFIAACKQVSASTVQILTSSGVHSDPSSKSQIHLNASAKHLMSSTEYLVKLCEESKLKDQMDSMDGESGNSVSASLTKLQADEMDAQVGILKMEQDLERARLKLAAVRKVRYSVARGNSGGASSSSSGAPPTLSPIKVSPFMSESPSPTTVPLSVSSARGLLLETADSETRSQVLDFARRVSQLPSPPILSPLTMSPLSTTTVSPASTSGGFLAVKASPDGRRPTTRTFVPLSSNPSTRNTSIFLSGGANRPGIGSVASTNAMKSKSPTGTGLPALPKLAKVVLQVLNEEGSPTATTGDAVVTSEAVP
jgi:talin